MREVAVQSPVPLVPLEAHYVVSDGCSLNCSHCPYSFRGGAALNHDSRVEVLKTLAHYEIDHVLLIAPDCGRIGGLTDTITAGTELGLDFDLFVAGPMPGPKFWFNAAKSGVNSIMFEIFGDVEFHNAHTQPGSFEQTLAAMECALACGLKVVGVLRLLRGCGCNLSCLPGRLPDGTAGIIAQHYIPFDMGQICYAIAEEKSLELWRTLHINAYPTPVTYASCARSVDRGASKICSAGRYKLAIRADGLVLPCEHLRGEPALIGDIRNDEFSRIWSAPLLEQIRNQHPGTYGGECGECVDQDRCSVCRALGFNFLGDIESSLPACDIPGKWVRP